MTSLFQSVELIEGSVHTGLLVLFRLTAMVSVLPGFGQRFLPTRVKLATGVAFTIVTFPLLDHTAAISVSAILSETAIGLALGLVVRFFLIAVQTAGSMIAQSTSLAQLVGMANAEPIPAIGQLLTISAVSLMMITGAPVKFTGYILLTYDIWPIGQFPTAAQWAEWSIPLINHLFALGFSLSAPFLIVALLYNIALGLINRAMPQLMVAFIGAPFITFAAIALLFLTIPTLLALWNAALTSFLTEFPKAY